MLRAEVNRHVTSWAREGDRLSYDAQSMLLRVTGEDASVTIIEVACPEVDRVALNHDVTVTPRQIDAAPGETKGEREVAVMDEIERIVRQRDGLLSAQTSTYAGMVEVVLTYTLFCDGLNHHTFMHAVREIERAKTMMVAYVERLVERAETGRRRMEEPDEVRPGDLTR